MSTSALATKGGGSDGNPRRRPDTWRLFALMLRKELVLGILSQKFLISLVLVAILVMIGTYVQLRRYERDLAVYSANAVANEMALRELEDPSDLVVSGVTLGRRPPTLSALASGLADVTPRQVTVSFVAPPKTDEGVHENPLYFLYAVPDYVYVVRLILSLLAILFVFDSVSGEKERGTLRQTLANAVPRDIVMMGKWVGGYITLVIPLLTATAFGLIFLYLSPALQLGAADWVRVLLIILSALMYLAVFFSLGLFVSAITHRSAISLATGLFLWVLLVLTIPSLVPLIARQVAPTPSDAQLAARRGAAEQVIRRSYSERFRSARGSAESAAAWRDYRAEVRRAVQPIEAEARNAVQRQMSVARNLSRLSPSATFSFIATALARTGPSDHQAFVLAVRRHAETLRTHLDGLRFQGMKSPTQTTLDPEKIPRFEAPVASLTSSLRSVAFDIALLVIFNCIFFLLAYVTFLRYEAC